MPRPVRLPDVMPEIEKPTLLVICDSHRCKLVGVSGKLVFREEMIESKEEKFDERQSLKGGAGGRGKMGFLAGTSDVNQIEQNRLRDFANVIAKRLGSAVRDQGIQALHVSAPAKFLSLLRTHLPTELAKLVESALDGNFVKEPARDALLRFRPDLRQAAQMLRDQESYSPRKQPPKKTRRRK